MSLARGNRAFALAFASALMYKGALPGCCPQERCFWTIVWANFWSRALAWPMYVISLERATQRRAASQRALEAIGAPFEFFDAVEGARLTEVEAAAAYDAEGNAHQYERPPPCRKSAATLAITRCGGASSTRNSTAP